MPTAAASERSPIDGWVVGVLEQQAGKLRSAEMALRAGRPDAVHKVRVAARRLRATLATHGPLLPTPEAALVADDLRWLGVSLSSTRDLQVVRERLVARLAAQPPELVVGAVLERIGASLADPDPDQDGAGGLAVLNSGRYRRLWQALDGFVSPARPRICVPAEETASVVRVALRGNAKRVCRAMDRADRAVGRGARDLALHTVRKRAKQLRYSADSGVPVLGDPARRLVAPASRIQVVLGGHQDSVVTRWHLLELARSAREHGESDFTYGLLHALEEEAARRDRARYEKARRRLVEAVSGLD